MVYTHLPANAFLMAAAFMPSAPLAVDVPAAARGALPDGRARARRRYVMAVVAARGARRRGERDQRAAQPRARRSRRSLAGALLALSSFGWPLVIGGALKIAYDLLLLVQFHSIEPRSGDVP